MTEGYRSAADVPSHREPLPGDAGANPGDEGPGVDAPAGAPPLAGAPAGSSNPGAIAPGVGYAPLTPPPEDTVRPATHTAQDSGARVAEIANEAGQQVAETAKDSGRQVAETAKDSGRQVAETAQEAGRQVADTAKDEAQRTAGAAADAAKQTAREATAQARELYAQTTQELSTQARQHQERLASGLGSFAHELSAMAEASSEQGLATDLARQAADRAQRAARWLEDRSPEEVLADVRRFARRRPGAFLAIAGGLGFLAGRTLRGLKDASSDDEPAGSAQGLTGSYGGQLS